MLTQIWRHPIKGIGREPVAHARLTPGRGLSYDRLWAVAHAGAKLASHNADGWFECHNFSRGDAVPLLQAVESTTDIPTGTVTLTHPRKPGLTLDPDNAADQLRLFEWLADFLPASAPKPVRVVRAENAMTDSRTVSLSLINLASNAAIGEALGQPISPLRWRGNLLVSAMEPWQERDLVGRDIRIGTAEFHIRKEITRCRMPMANPETGERDADILGVLNRSWGVMEMGVHAVVTKPGEIAVDDAIEVLT